MTVPQHLHENKFFQQLAGRFPRSPRQVNYLLEGGAEIICLENGAILALTTGSIVEEIATGLYTGPRHTGWMSVAVNLPEWVFLAGPHGKFELVFTIPKEKEKAFLKKAGEMEWEPLKIGTMTEDRRCTLQISPKKKQPIDAFQIANLFTESGGDVQVYLSKLVQIHESWTQHG